MRAIVWRLFLLLWFGVCAHAQTYTIFDPAGVPQGRVDCSKYGCDVFAANGLPVGRMDPNGYLFNSAGLPVGRIDVERSGYWGSQGRPVYTWRAPFAGTNLLSGLGELGNEIAEAMLAANAIERQQQALQAAAPQLAAAGKAGSQDSNCSWPTFQSTDRWFRPVAPR
jgi:hypothetical protein